MSLRYEIASSFVMARSFLTSCNDRKVKVSFYASTGMTFISKERRKKLRRRRYKPNVHFKGMG